MDVEVSTGAVDRYLGEELNSVAGESQKSNWENENLSQIPFKVFRGHRDAVNSCVFCINGTHVLSGSDDGTAKLWSARGTKLITNYAAHTGPVSAVKVTKDSKQFLTCSWDKSVRLWDLETGKILWTGKHNGMVMAGDISLDGKLVVSCSDFDNAVKVWNAEDGQELTELKNHHSSTPTCCSFSPNGQRIVSTSFDKVTKIWDRVSETVTATLTDHLNIVSSCCFSEKERYLCTGSWDKTLRLYDISTGMYRTKGSKVLDKGHEGCVSCCRFSTDGQTLISGGYDKAVILWDVSNYVKKLVLKGHEDWITDVDTSIDKKWILSASKDKTVRMWNIENADHIPAVVESRHAMGLKIMQCEKCGKSFSIAQLEDVVDTSICVFCRLADPERNTLPSIL
ncbi:small ribosomal subunit protein RACK1-like [Styela clava]|uniref:WD repeat-containing protein 88-like n=1 Tax=Styela clava TaxID=7725 RepID=UPI00193AAEB9|nr:WD repeat-containing protein 88-like [Styela clava]